MVVLLKTAARAKFYVIMYYFEAGTCKLVRGHQGEWSQGMWKVPTNFQLVSMTLKFDIRTTTWGCSLGSIRGRA